MGYNVSEIHLCSSVNVTAIDVKLYIPGLIDNLASGIFLNNSYVELWIFTNNPTLAHILVGNTRSELGQTDDRVVCGLEVREVLAEEGLEPRHIRQGEVMGRCECLCSESKAEEEHP